MASAYFFLSDIRGYTAYLTSAELDHAQEILNTLFEAQLDRIQPPLRVAKLEGDAIFAYLPDEVIGHGQTILDTVESLYAGFRKVRKAMRMNTTCVCRACKGIGSLDLKFFVHHGEYAVQRLMGQEELAGPAVILAHRLMKNTVEDRTGLKAYALFTEAAIEAMDMHAAAAGFVRHTESYEHLGTVAAFVYDLHSFWERVAGQRREIVTEEQATAVARVHAAAPPAVVWDILTNPETRGRVNSGTVAASGQQAGRIGVGTNYHCAHHDGSSTDELILDMEPLEYLTTRETMHEPGMDIIFPMTSRIDGLEDGTSRLSMLVGAPRSADPGLQEMLEGMWPEATAGIVEHIERHATEAYAEILAERGIEEGG